MKPFCELTDVDVHNAYYAGWQHWGYSLKEMFFLTNFKRENPFARYCGGETVDLLYRVRLILDGGSPSFPKDSRIIDFIHPDCFFEGMSFRVELGYFLYPYKEPAFQVYTEEPANGLWLISEQKTFKRAYDRLYQHYLSWQIK